MEEMWSSFGRRAHCSAIRRILPKNCLPILLPERPSLLADPPSSAVDAGMRCRVQRAEAVWIAGGDQWDYLGRWHDSLRVDLAELQSRGAVLGGTSAGAMVLGAAAFSARNGSISSEDALLNPNDIRIDIVEPVFAQPELDGTIVDTHFFERDREGRLLAFAARYGFAEESARVVGVGLDERSSLVIEGGRYVVFTDAGASVWLYLVDSPTAMVDGAPLHVSRVLRVGLPDGSSGEWPLDFNSVSPDTLRVDQGTITR